jgi:hypothetical protein
MIADLSVALLINKLSLKWKSDLREKSSKRSKSLLIKDSLKRFRTEMASDNHSNNSCNKMQDIGMAIQVQVATLITDK